MVELLVSVIMFFSNSLSHTIHRDQLAFQDLKAHLDQGSASYNSFIHNISCMIV